jgi:hypothetical protein
LAYISDEVSVVKLSEISEIVDVAASARLSENNEIVMEEGCI